MNEPKFEDITRATQVKSTVFEDGMIVTADDLKTAMLYPIGLFQTLLRAYFGCGIVCGLEVSREAVDAEKTYCVKVKPGVALDCEGHPLQLCESVKIDLTPDPCVDPWPETVCIAIRRDTSAEASRDDGDACDGGDKPRHCRQREQVLIRVFPADENCKDKLPDFCARPEPPDDAAAAQRRLAPTIEQECVCLEACPACSCCGESWVLLACVGIRDDCTVEVDDRRRKYVKPIECRCSHRTAVTLDVTGMTVKQTEDAMQNVKDLDVLIETGEAEKAGRNRKGVISALEARRKQLGG